MIDPVRKDFIRLSPTLLFWLALALFACLALAMPGNRWVDDESWYLMPVPTIWSEGTFRVPNLPGADRFWANAPLLTYFAALVERIWLSEFTARLIPALSAMALIFAAFRIGARSVSVAAGALAAFYVAADNVVFLAARTVRPDILVACFAMLSLAALVRWRALGSGSLWLGIAGLCTGLAVSSHPNGLLSLATSGLYLLMFAPGGLAQRLLPAVRYTVFALLAIIPLALWVSYYDAAHDYAAFRQLWIERYSRYADTDVSFLTFVVSQIQFELSTRYSDFMQFPFRVHIAVASLALVVAGLIGKSLFARFLALTVLGHMVFFAFVNTSNPSMRYLTVTTPFVALLAGMYSEPVFQWLRQPLSLNGRQLVAVLLVGVIGASQFAGNLFYLYRFRHADFVEVTGDLNTLIEPGTTVYGGMAFWMGFREHEYVPYMRMPWARAVAEKRPDYVIMDDWVMMGGRPEGIWKDLRVELNAYLSEHGELVGRVSNPFYGDLRVFRVRYPNSDE